MDRLGYRTASEPFAHSEFVVNDVPLAELLAAPPRDPSGRRIRLDFVPPSSFPYGGEESVARLLLEAPADLPDGRQTILVCPLCGDIGCGVISADVDRDGDVIVWRNFASQSPTNDPVAGWYTPIANVEPMRFEERAYRLALLEMLRTTALRQ